MDRWMDGWMDGWMVWDAASVQGVWQEGGTSCAVECENVGLHSFSGRSKITAPEEAKTARGSVAQATIPDRTLRDMIRQWFPASQRTSTGYYKNVSVIPRADPFQ